MNLSHWALTLLLPALNASGQQPFGPKPVSSAVFAERASSESSRKPTLLLGRLFLFPEFVWLEPALVVTSASGEESHRLFHQPGDPDSLFTFGSPTPKGELRLKAAFEVNDVVLRAIAPDLRVDPSDTRPRAAGDYRALDARGRPYMLRLGARLVW